MLSKNEVLIGCDGTHESRQGHEEEDSQLHLESLSEVKNSGHSTTAGQAASVNVNEGSQLH